MKSTDIDKAFGVGESTGQGKSMLIRKMLKIRPMDPEWSLRSMAEQNPMAWMIKVNGFLIDARRLKPEIQEELLRGVIAEPQGCCQDRFDAAIDRLDFDRPLDAPAGHIRRARAGFAADGIVRLLGKVRIQRLADQGRLVTRSTRGRGAMIGLERLTLPCCF